MATFDDKGHHAGVQPRSPDPHERAHLALQTSRPGPRADVPISATAGMRDHLELMPSRRRNLSSVRPLTHSSRLNRLAHSLLPLGLAVIVAACGSARSSSSTSGALATTASTAATRSTAPANGATAPRATEGRELDQFPPVAPAATAILPSPPTSPTVERAYLTALFDDAQSVWRREFEAAHLQYPAARVSVFYSVTKSACGHHESSGPFYCPADRTVYLDTRFLTLLLRNGRVGAAAQAYIVGHEIGHHIQRLIRIAERLDAANRADPGGKNARSVQIELQADCLAGVWARSAYPRSGLTLTQLREGLRTAKLVGDDYVAQATGQVVDRTIWTHGSSEQRQNWLRTGYDRGRPSTCDTFVAG